MNWKNVTVIVCSIFILASIGLGVSIIYSDYLYNPIGSLNTLQVMSNVESEYPAYAVSTTDVPLFNAIKKWAKEEQATILFKNGLSAGCGFYGFSDWLKQEVGIDGYSDNECAVYVADDPAIEKAYVNDNVFLPESVGLKIAGIYSTADLPSVLTNVDFLYPLSIAATADGMYFTDTKDIEKLAALFDANGYSVIVSRQYNHLTFGELIKRLASESFLSKAVLFAMIGLIFCFVYNILMLYKDNTHKLWIHHLFGLSKKQIFLKIILLTTGMILAAALIFRIVLLNSLTYMNRSDLSHIFNSTLLLYLMLNGSVNMIGYWQLSRQFKLKGA